MWVVNRRRSFIFPADRRVVSSVTATHGLIMQDNEMETFLTNISNDSVRPLRLLAMFILQTITGNEPRYN
jgi:hypothetical protein